MQKNPVVILHTDNPDAARELVAAAHPELTIQTCSTYDGLPKMVADTGCEVVYSVRFAGTPAYPRKALLESGTVKWVSVGGSGTDHLSPWDPERLTVTNAAGVAADMMAQYALGAMLHFSLNLPAFKTAQKERQWLAGKVEPLDGKTVLIVGLGKTGEAVAARCKAMDMNTLGVRARPKPTPNVDEVHGIDALPHLWHRADFIVACVPLLGSTRGIVGTSAFQQMKPEAALIDVSRGGVVEETSLLSALDAGRIRGAALDVFAVEPLPEDSRLWDYDNVIITPHCSSVYDGWDLKSVQMFSENLKRYRAGEPLTNVVDPRLGY